MKDIAHLSGVSAATVSLVLNNNETKRVSREKRDQILDIAQQLNYRPNYSARCLVKQESRTIGLVVTSFANPFYSEIAQDIILRAKEMGYSVVASSARMDDIDDERRSVHDLLDRGVDGLVICSALRNDPVITDLINYDVPFVLALRRVDRRPGETSPDFVVVDNHMGAFQLTEHLIRMGHRKIALFTGDLRASTGYHRLEGAKAALKLYGFSPDQSIVLNGDFQRPTGFRLALKLLEGKELPTAIFAHNDHMAIGAIECFVKEGMKVPDDIGVIGFDDIEMAGLPGIDLTTVSQTKCSMGQTAVDILLEKIEKKSERITKQFLLNPILVIRKSCGFDMRGRSYIIDRRIVNP